MRFKQFMEESQLEPLYFGCKNGPGHYVFRPDGNEVSRRDNPYAAWLKQHDAKIATGWGKQGVIVYKQFPEFVIIAYTDYTVDSRPGSNSMFLIPGNLSESEAIQQAKSLFPWA